MYRVRILNPVMGVPITFLGKWNPDQFELITAINGGSKHKDMLGNVLKPRDNEFVTSINGQAKYARILIRGWSNDV